jgi:hypothetical protein
MLEPFLSVDIATPGILLIKTLIQSGLTVPDVESLLLVRMEQYED